MGFLTFGFSMNLINTSFVNNNVTYWSLRAQFWIQFRRRMGWYRLSNATGDWSLPKQPRYIDIDDTLNKYECTLHLQLIKEGSMHYGTWVLRTGSMEHPPKSPSPISILFSKLGKIGLKKMLWGVVLPHGTFFNSGASFSQWTSQ